MSHRPAPALCKSMRLCVMCASGAPPRCIAALFGKARHPAL